MAFAAMAQGLDEISAAIDDVAQALNVQGLDEISAAIDDVAQALNVRKGSGCEEEPLPEGDRPAPAEEEPQVVVLAGLGAGGQRSQVRPQIACVVVGDLGKRR